MSGYQDAAQAPKFYYGNAMADLAEVLPQENPADIEEARLNACALQSEIESVNISPAPEKVRVAEPTLESLSNIESKLSQALRLRSEFSYILRDIQRLLGK